MPNSVTVPADLLNHERSLSDGLEALASATTAGRSRSAWLRLRALARSTDIGAAEIDNLGSAIDSVHELDVNIDHDVLAFGLHLLSATGTLFPTKHSFKFLEDVSKGLLATAGPTPLGFVKLVLEAFEAGEPLTSTEGTAWTEGTLPTKGILLLLITRHASLIIDASFSIVAQCLVSVVDLCKFLLGFIARVHIWMVLLR